MLLVWWSLYLDVIVPTVSWLTLPWVLLLVVVLVSGSPLLYVVVVVSCLSWVGPAGVVCARFLSRVCFGWASCSVLVGACLCCGRDVDALCRVIVLGALLVLSPAPICLFLMNLLSDSLSLLLCHPAAMRFRMIRSSLLEVSDLPSLFLCGRLNLGCWPDCCVISIVDPWP